MSASRVEQEIRVLSLGEIVTPNQLKGIQGLAALTGTDDKTIFKAVMQSGDSIKDLKMGKLEETRFDSTFIDNIKNATGKTITTAEFNRE